MMEEVRIVEVTSENVDAMPCCGILDRNHEGHLRKTAWLKEQFSKGLRAKILLFDGTRQCGYIEYLPGRHAWRGIEAEGYLVIHCLWVFYKRFQNRGYGAELIESAVADARAQAANGVAVVARSGPWLAGDRVFLKNGFVVVDRRPPDYLLLVRKLQAGAPDPRFLPEQPGGGGSYGEGLTVVRAGQCPHAIRFAEKIAACSRADFQLPTRIVELENAEQAQYAPTPYAAFSVLLDGKVLADHQISETRFRSIMRKLGFGSEARGTRS